MIKLIIWIPGDVGVIWEEMGGTGTSKRFYCAGAI